jgi:hypothetical protein
MLWETLLWQVALTALVFRLVLVADSTQLREV